MSAKKSHIRKLLSGIRNRIIGGFFVILPIMVTFWLAYFIYTKMTEWSFSCFDWIPLLSSYKSMLMNHIWFTTAVRMVSIILMLTILFLIGQLAKYALGQRLIDLAERIMLRIPMLNIIYSTMRQIWNALWSPKDGMFRQVVLFEYPRKGIYVIGFLTNENRGEWELHARTGKELISIFLPTTPNPTSGFLLFVPREDCIYLDMDVAEGMRLVISGGAITSLNDGKSQEAPNEIQPENNIE